MNEADLAQIVKWRNDGLEDDSEVLQWCADPMHERSGGGTFSLASKRRFQAMVALVLDGDIDTFRRRLSESVQLTLSLYQRFERGDPIGDSFVTLHGHRDLYSALALGDRETATDFARHLIRQHDLSRGKIRTVDLAFGMCHCAFVVNDRQGMEHWAAKFGERSRSGGEKSYIAYHDVFVGILHESVDEIKLGIENVAKLHRRQCGINRLFDVTEKDLCIWGIGMVNLARWHGLQALAHPPLIPEHFLVPIP